MALTILAVTCTGNGGEVVVPVPSPTRPAATAAAPFHDPFLNLVVETDGPADDAMAAFFDQLRGSYTGREAYFEALIGTNLADAIAAVLERARMLDPPEEHAEGYRLWVDKLEEELELSRDYERALEARDLVSSAVLATRIQAEFLDMLAEVTKTSPGFCRAVASGGTARLLGPDRQRFLDRTCVDGDELPGGEYGRRANAIARETGAVVGPLIGGFEWRLLEQDEYLAYLAENNPLVDARFAHAADTLSRLSPPDGLAGDHRGALTYFEDIADIARRITQAAKAGDFQAFQQAADESEGPGMRFTERLSATGRTIFEVPGLPGVG